MSDDAALREQLAKLRIPFEVDRRAPADPARAERLDAVKRWYAQDWLSIHAKLRSSIIEGLSVFLSVFDLPDVAATFCPPKPAAEAQAAPDEPPAPAARRAGAEDALREIGAAGYDRGFGDAEAGRGKPPGWPRRSPADRPGDAAEYVQSDAAARAYVRGFDDHFRGATREDAASRRLQVDYVREVTAIGEDQQAALRYGPRAGSARAAERSPLAAAGDRDRDTMPSR